MLDNEKYHLFNEEQVKGKTTQSIINVSQMFRRWIVQNQVNVQEYQPKNVSIINKVIIKQIALFNVEAQKHRNDVMRNLEKYMEFVIDQHRKVVESIEHNNIVEMHKHLRVQRLNVEHSDNTCMR